MSPPKVVIVGGGLAGSLLAVSLGQDGYPVEVYEKRPDIRKAEIVRGRSINLALSTRGIHALQEVGLDQRVLEEAVPMRGRLMHSVEGELTFQPYGTEESQVINSVSRAGLNQLLLEEADRLDNVTLHFDHPCLDVDLESQTLTFEYEGAVKTVSADLIVGADGAFSAIRHRLQRTDRFSYSQDYLEYGYKELHIPAADGGGFRLEKNVLHIWPRQSSMMIALPNADGTFTCTLFWPFEGELGFSALRTPDDVRDHFEKYYRDAFPHLPTLVDDYLSVPPSSLVTIRCWPWSHGRLTLLGDACHAVVPFYGQGMNAAFEDVSELKACLNEYAPDYERAFDAYQNRRRENANAIADLALENFLVMRDRVTSPLFLLGNRLGKILHRVFPRWFIPLYSLVTFSRVPYAEARRRARRQVRFLKRLGFAAAIILLILLGVWLWP